jgi:hypothetical protein
MCPGQSRADIKQFKQQPAECPDEQQRATLADLLAAEEMRLAKLELPPNEPAIPHEPTSEAGQDHPLG